MTLPYYKIPDIVMTLPYYKIPDIVIIVTVPTSLKDGIGRTIYQSNRKKTF